jgi:hypothetical protein
MKFEQRGPELENPQKWIMEWQPRLFHVRESQADDINSNA